MRLLNEFVYPSRRDVIQIMPGNRTKNAKAWLYSDNLGSEGRCNLCQKVIKAKGGRTSSMIKLLTTVHEDNIKLNELNPSKVSESQSESQYGYSIYFSQPIMFVIVNL